MKFCKVHHFANNTNLLCFLIKVLMLTWNALNWLNIHKVLLNMKKNLKCLYPNLKEKNIDKVKIKLSSKGYPTASVDYLGFGIDENLTWHHLCAWPHLN